MAGRKERETIPKRYHPIKKTKASDLIIEEIWSAILNGVVKPGDRLPPERELVKQFGVSKVTLREALQALEANGYIERRRGGNGGSVVLELAPTKGIQLISNYLGSKRLSVEELIDVRLMLDPLIAETVARTITKKDIHQLDLLLRKHEKDYIDTGKSKFGWHFEQYLAILTKNKLVIVMEDLLIHLVRTIETQRVTAEGTGDRAQERLFAAYYRNTFEDHRAIAQAIIRHDAAGARAAMTAHREAWARIFRKMVGGAKSFPLVHDAP